MTKARFEIRLSRKAKALFRQKMYVVLVGENGEDLQSSEMLSGRTAAHTNIDAVRKAVNDAAPTVDLTRQ